MGSVLEWVNFETIFFEVMIDFLLGEGIFMQCML